MSLLIALAILFQMLTNASGSTNDQTKLNEAIKVLENTKYHIDKNGIVVIDETGGNN